MSRAQQAAARRKALIADVRWILRTDPTANRDNIAARLGKKPGALERALYRYGRSDLVERMADRTRETLPSSRWWTCGGPCCARKRRGKD